MTSTDLVWGSESLSSESEVLALSLKWPDTESHDPDLFTLARDINRKACRRSRLVQPMYFLAKRNEAQYPTKGYAPHSGERLNTRFFSAFTPSHDPSLSTRARLVTRSTRT